MIKAFFTSLILTLLLVGCGNSNIPTVVIYGCNDKSEWNICRGKPAYLGEISFIISKEGKSIKAMQKPNAENTYFSDSNLSLINCSIGDANNWSCKEKSQFGELYYLREMVDGFYMSSNSSQFINGSGLDYVGYQGIKGQLIKYGLWHPTDIFKEGKATP